MDPLSAVQLRILREAATPEGCREWQANSAKRLLRLVLVEQRGAWEAQGPRLFATAAGREWLRKVDAK